MSTDLAGKRVLVLSDNSGLARAVELNLTYHLKMEVIRFVSSPSLQSEDTAKAGDFDLLVLAISSPANEPVVALARASLTEKVGRIPLLIISDRPFFSEPEDQIAHLDFPFSVDTLQNKVGEMLLREPQEDADRYLPSQV